MSRPIAFMTVVVGLWATPAALDAGLWFDIGDQVEAAQVYPTYQNVWLPTSGHPADVVVGTDVELPAFPPAQPFAAIDLGAGTVQINFTLQVPAAPAEEINGFRFADIHDALDPVYSVTLLNNTLSGFDASRITFNDDQVFIDLQSLVVSPTASILIQVNTAPLPALALPAGNVIDFGPVRVGTTGLAGATIQNTGEAGSELVGSASAASGDFAGPVSGGSFSLDSGVDVAVTYAFTPTQSGSRVGHVNLTTNGGDAAVTLVGAGVGPVYESDATPGGTLDFGTLLLHESAGLQLEITNAATTSYSDALDGMTLTDIAINGGDAGLFAFDAGAIGQVISAGGMMDLGLTFAGGSDARTYNATLDITTDVGAAFGQAGQVFSYAITADVAAPPDPDPPYEGTFEAGDQLKFSWMYPDKLTLLHANDRPGTLEPVLTVGEGVELTDFPLSAPTSIFTIDLESGRIILTVAPNRNLSVDEMVAFNGVRIADVNGTLPAFTEVLVDPATTVTGFDASNVTFTDDLIFVDVQGTTLASGLTIVLLVNPMPVPEPALGVTLLLSVLATCRATRART